MIRSLREYLIVALAALLVGLVTSGLQLQSFHIPLSYEDDALFSTMVIKNLSENHFWTLPRLGAPDQSNLYHFPVPEFIHLLELKFLLLFSSNPFLISNIFFISTFVTSATSAFFVSKKLGISTQHAFCTALLFCTIPYHFIRLDKHLLLSSFALVPLICLLLIQVVKQNIHTKKDFFWIIVLAVVTTGSGLYYIYFSILLLAMTSAILFVREKRVQILLPTILFSLTALATYLIQVYPSILYIVANGKNNDTAARHGFEVVNNGLQLLFMSIPNHTFGLAILEKYHTSVAENMEQKQYLGIASLIGIGYGLYYFFTKKITQKNHQENQYLGLLTLCLLLASAGGLGVVIGYVISPQIRSYSRIIPFISFFALLLLEKVFIKIQTYFSVPSHGNALVLLLTSMLIFEQTCWFKPKYPEVATVLQSDQSFFTYLEQTYPNTMIFQLPYKPFPESPPIIHSKDYDLLKPYLHTSSLTFSYGSPIGSSEDLKNKQLTQLPTADLFSSIKKLGFTGVLIDSYAYTPHELQLRVQNNPFLASPDGRWIWIDLSKE